MTTTRMATDATLTAMITPMANSPPTTPGIADRELGFEVVDDIRSVVCFNKQ